MSALLEIDNVTLRFGGVVAVNQVSFNVEEGEVFALVGPNGAGKSTLFNLIAGNIAPDGSAAFYNVIFNIADKVKARSFPMPLPVIAASARERELLHEQASIKNTLALAAKASVTFVGVGDLGANAPLYEDGFVSREELKALQKAGGVGEMLGWIFDSQGNLIDGMTNDRVASAPIPSRETSLVIAAARGANKVEAVRAAVRRRLVNGLITDEDMARALLA